MAIYIYLRRIEQSETYSRYEFGTTAGAVGELLIANDLSEYAITQIASDKSPTFFLPRCHRALLKCYKSQGKLPNQAEYCA